MTASSGNKIEWADGVRGLAAITVVLQHFINTFFPRHERTLSLSWKCWMVRPYLPDRAFDICWQFFGSRFLCIEWNCRSFSLSLSRSYRPVYHSIFVTSTSGSTLCSHRSSFSVSYVMYLTHAYDATAEFKFISLMDFKPKFKSFGQFLLDTFIGIWTEDGRAPHPSSLDSEFRNDGGSLYVVLLACHNIKHQARITIVIILCSGFGIASTFYGVNLIYYHDFLVGLLIGMFIVWKSQYQRWQKWQQGRQRLLINIFGFFLFILGLFFGSYPLYIEGDPGYWKVMQSISDPTFLEQKF